jgi:SAM-dependent methyltransferase
MKVKLMTDHEEYFTYLMRRSRLGHIYRRQLLYPQLIKRLPGLTLDVGCGIGDMLAFHPNMVGVDINERNVQYCQAIKLDAHMMRPDCLPFNDSTFNSVLMDNVMEHIEDPTMLLADIRRVLQPKGRLLVGVPGLRGWASDSDHKVFYDEEILVNALEKNQFKCEELFHTPLIRSDLLSKFVRQ